MSRDLDNYQQQYTLSPFEETLARVRKEVIAGFLRERQFRNILEVGCGVRSLAESLDDFDSFDVVEPGQEFLERAQRFVRTHQCSNRIHFHHQRFEEFRDTGRVDCIVISGLLHELGDPTGFLRHAFDIAPRGCWLHVNVPNAKSFHRLWAVEAGLIKTEYDKSVTQVRLQQNHTFDSETLGKLVRDNGFSVVESGSYFIKPFTHSQMQQLVNLGVLTDALIAGLMKMERHAPGLGAEIFVNAHK